MNLTRIPTIALGALLVMDSSGQCNDITVGTYDGTPVLGNAHTPFPTNTGANNRRGHRVQYLYPAAELLGAGLCPGPVSAITFYAVGSDYACDTFVNCPDLKLDLRIGHTALSGFGPDVASQSTPLDVDWDADTEASPQMYANNNVAFTVGTGPVHFQLAGGGFNWNGVDNLVLDISWMRAAAVGTSPAVQLEEDLPYTATKWVQVTSSFNVEHGNTYEDAPLTLNATTGTTTTRPVITINSTDAMLSNSVPTAGTGKPEVRVDALSGEVVVSMSDDRAGTRIACLDPLGRELAAEIAVGKTIRIPIPTDYEGVLLVTAQWGSSVLSLGKVTVMRR
jgi:hypothetical protein